MRHSAQSSGVPAGSFTFMFVNTSLWLTRDWSMCTLQPLVIIPPVQLVHFSQAPKKEEISSEILQIHFKHTLMRHLPGAQIATLSFICNARIVAEI